MRCRPGKFANALQKVSDIPYASSTVVPTVSCHFAAIASGRRSPAVKTCRIGANAASSPRGSASSRRMTVGTVKSTSGR